MIVPDFFDVVALFEAGITNVVALMDPEASAQRSGTQAAIGSPRRLESWLKEKSGRCATCDNSALKH